MKIQKKWIVIIILCYIALMGISFFSPVIIKNIMDRGIIEKNLQVILKFAVFLLLLAIAEEGISILQARIFLDLHNHVVLNLYMKVFQKLLHVRMKYFKQHNSTELMNRLSTDIESVSLLVDSSMLNIFRYVFQIISGIIGLFVINWRLAFLVLLIVPVKYLLIRVFADKKEKSVRDWMEAETEFAAWFADTIQGVQEIKLWNLYRSKQRELRNRQKEVLGFSKKSSLLETYNLSSDSILQGAMVTALYGIGGYFACQGKITLGGVTAFLSYSNYVTGPIALMFNLRFIFARIKPSMERLKIFLKEDVEQTVKDGREIQQFKKEICFEHVKFGYEEQPVLKDISLKIKKGEKVVLIGENGSGKSTLISLLLRFFEPDEGHVYIDGLDIKDCKIESYRNLFSVVSQDIYLFHDTVRNNVVMEEDVDDDLLKSIIGKLQLNSLLQSLPKGYDSVLEGNGENLSGGERQKIALLRAMIKDVPILIFDEATAHIDKEYDEFLHDYILREFSDKTLIMITHKREHLEGMDRIYEIKEGVCKRSHKTYSYK